jgi:hypothetical protein
MSLGLLVLAALLPATVQGEEGYDEVSFDVTNALIARFTALEEQNAALEEKLNSILAGGTDKILSSASTDVPSYWAGECGEPYCNNGGVYADVELMFLGYHQEGGVEDSAGNNADFGFDISSRFEVGAVRSDGLGVRVRFWNYDHSENSTAGNVVDVKAFYVDAEILQRVSLPCDVNVVASGGLRFAEFEQTVQPTPTSTDFSGFGGTICLEVRRRLQMGNLFVRGRLSSVLGNIDAMNSRLVFFRPRVAEPITQPFKLNSVSDLN